MNERGPMGSFEFELEALRFKPGRGAPQAARARVRGRLQATIAGLAVGAGKRASGFSPTKSDLAATARGVSRWVLPGVLVLGGLVGAGVHAALVPAPTERIIYVDRWVEVPTSPPATAAPAAPPEAPPSATAVRGSSPAASARAVARPLRGLRAERALLEDARKSLGAGAYGDAFDSLSLHAIRFPEGLLAEEREALMIKTLAASGQADEAQRRAEAFRTRFPNSLFGPSVAEALEAIR